MAVRLQSNKPKPYTVLTEVQSESGSWKYEIRVSHVTGVQYCTCRGHQFNKKCKHMDAYLKNPTIAVATPSQIGIRPKHRTPGEALRDELLTLGHTISLSVANAISKRVLEAGGKTGITAASDNIGENINAAGVRVIILPD